MRALIFTAAACCLAFSGVKMKADDSIATRVDSTMSKSLNEVVVEAERGWIEEDGTMVFIPTKHEKNIATDPATLIKAMHLPVVRDVKGTLTGLSGQPVTFYINGTKATDIDMATFWAKRTRRVEYMEAPKDPQFEGDHSVINIVIAEYETGGVTRAQLNQAILTTYGNYSLASKMEHKGFTLGAMAHYIDTRNRSIGARGYDDYRDLFYNSTHYDDIVRNFTEKGTRKSEYAQFALMGRLKTGKLTTTHQLAFVWYHNPGSHSSAADLWTPDLFDSSQSTATSALRQLSPQITGNYHYQFDSRWSFLGSWRYKYARNNAANSSEITGLPAVTTDNREDINSLFFGLMPTFWPNYSMVFQLKARSAINWYDLRYTGTTAATARQRRSESSLALMFWWEPLQSLTLSVEPGLSVSAWDINGLDRTQLYPMAALNIYWTASRKLTLNATLDYYNIAPTASESSDVVIRSSELMWLSGNPHLNNNESWQSMIRCTWLASRLFNLSGRVNYTRNNNLSVAFYEAAPAEAGGLVRSEFNVPSNDTWSAAVNFSLNLLSGDLSLTLSPTVDHNTFTGPYACRHTAFRIGAGASYSIGDCSFDIDYASPTRNVYEGGMEHYRSRDEFNASFSYGNGDLMLSASVDNIFNTHTRDVTETLTPHFITGRSTYDVGRRVMLSATFFFGYGKKVSKSIDISGAQDTESSALKR